MQEQNLHTFDEKLNYLERFVLSQDEYCEEEKKEQAKQTCYPVRDAYRITETCAEINLRDLMDHTAERLATYLEDDVFEHLSPEERQSLTLISKWGCDGSQQSQFKEKMQDLDAKDSNIFQSC
ncbi:hypothetical protein HF086_015214 [Spodoptera exigua]|uniref:Uncharacterized protein n=1 Tax=Spodoptera exigua TaxID=7107 RepID=A0A922MQQ8_SPOEX|nr:hypothetical protein HF086_015214 [Spodoptera exigua]